MKGAASVALFHPKDHDAITDHGRVCSCHAAATVKPQVNRSMVNWSISGVGSVKASTGAPAGSLPVCGGMAKTVRLGGQL
jgi:hypothetical protein